jgi:hypothetical protein
VNQHGKAALALRDLGSLNVRLLNVQEFPVVALINPPLAVGSAWIGCRQLYFHSAPYT